MNPKDRVSTDGGEALRQNPFAQLEGLGAGPATNVARARGPAPTPARQAGASAEASLSAGRRGRIDIRRETGGRGGKTVTVVEGFVGIGPAEKELLAKKMRAACGCGGTVKDGRIEIQGDQRPAVARILAEAGFRPVLAGG